MLGEAKRIHIACIFLDLFLLIFAAQKCYHRALSAIVLIDSFLYFPSDVDEEKIDNLIDCVGQDEVERVTQSESVLVIQIFVPKLVNCKSKE